MKPGLYDDISKEAYLLGPCDTPELSVSIAKLLIERSPLHAWWAHPKLGGGDGKGSEALRNGSILDSLLAGGDSEFADMPFEEFRTKEAKAARDEAIAAGKIPLRAGELAEWKRTATAIRTNFERLGVRLDGLTQRTMIWDETASDGTIVRCKGRMDFWHPDTAEIDDLKTCEDASPGAAAAAMLRFGYDIQCAAYSSAIAKLFPELAGRVRFRFLFAEKEPPNAVLPARPDGMMRSIGESKWRRAIDTWARCLRAQEFPGYDATEISAPSWAVNKELMIPQEGANDIPF